jgi:hypothetical protein
MCFANLIAQTQVSSKIYFRMFFQEDTCKKFPSSSTEHSRNTVGCFIQITHEPTLELSLMGTELKHNDSLLLR